MSIYKETSIIHIRAGEVDDHIKTWQCDSAGGVAGTLVIDTRRSFMHPGVGRREESDSFLSDFSPAAKYYDIRPIVELRRTNPEFRFFINSVKLDTTCTLSELGHHTWKPQTTEKPIGEYDVRFFEHTISKIEIGCTYGPNADIYLHVKEGYEHLWLPDGYKEDQPVNATKAKTYIVLMWANVVYGIPLDYTCC